jgi:hypothetical protein
VAQFAIYRRVYTDPGIDSDVEEITTNTYGREKRRKWGSE